MVDKILEVRGISENMVRITPNGEITFDPETKEYIVWDETYADTVCTTAYEQVARVALEAYAKYYL
jgi:hypothetical protein